MSSNVQQELARWYLTRQRQSHIEFHLPTFGKIRFDQTLLNMAVTRGIKLNDNDIVFKQKTKPAKVIKVTFVNSGITN